GDANVAGIKDHTSRIGGRNTDGYNDEWGLKVELSIHRSMFFQSELKAKPGLFSEALHRGAGGLHQGNYGLHVTFRRAEEVNNTHNHIRIPHNLKRLKLTDHGKVSGAFERVLFHFKIEERFFLGLLQLH